MFELLLRVPEQQVEWVSAALEECDAQSISVTDADAHSEVERALYAEPGLPVPSMGWARSSVNALFDTESAAQQAAVWLTAQELFSGCQVLALQALPEQDWVGLTQGQFSPVAITHDFWIVPTWHQVPEQAKRIIRLDPGLAFGTGTHPSTRMCLRWIAGHRWAGAGAGCRVLDYGCGSGILAIAAALYGAAAIDAVDIDPAAVRATRDNAESNGVRLAVGLPDMAMAQRRYDVVLANILAAPLQVLAPILSQHVAARGWLVLSGILSRQIQDLQMAYAPFCDLKVIDEEDGWACLCAQCESPS